MQRYDIPISIRYATWTKRTEWCRLCCWIINQVAFIRTNQINIGHKSSFEMHIYQEFDNYEKNVDSLFGWYAFGIHMSVNVFHFLEQAFQRYKYLERNCIYIESIITWIWSLVTFTWNIHLSNGYSHVCWIL